MYIIPLAPSPNQTFTSTIPINGKKLKLYFFLRYNTEEKCWNMDISDSNKKPLIFSIPLVCGCNILEQYDYLNIGSAYIVKLDNNVTDSEPNEYNLGDKFVLVWGDNE